MSDHIRTIRFPADLYRQVRVGAAMADQTVPEFVVEAVREWLEGEPEAPEGVSAPQAESARRGTAFPAVVNRKLERVAKRIGATAQDSSCSRATVLLNGD